MKVGDKVICVNDEDQMRASSPGFVVEWRDSVSKGKEYKVRGRRNDGGIFLEDVVGGIAVFAYDDSTHEVPFEPNRFRKVIRKKPFTNELTKKLANTPLIEEKVEEIKEKEPETV